LDDRLSGVTTAQVPVAAGTAGARRATRRAVVGWFALPATAVLLVFFCYPLITLVWQSFSDPSLGFENYLSLLHDGTSLLVLWRTLYTAMLVAACTLVIAYPYAYAMTRMGPRGRGVMTLLVLLPFWTSLMARNFAWYLLEERGGVVEKLLAAVGIDGVVLLGSVAGVAVAMVQVMLPYMVLPLYSSMNSIDRRLLDAATSLGAPWPRAFRKVYLPLSLPGVVSGVSLVFIMSLGFYITPSLLGSPQQALVSQVIGTQVNSLLDFAGAGALGTVLLVVTLLVLAVVNRFARPAAALNQAVDRA
jgi:putative spermidine/putrescine transport system permease protein